MGWTEVGRAGGNQAGEGGDQNPRLGQIYLRLRVGSVTEAASNRSRGHEVYRERGHDLHRWDIGKISQGPGGLLVCHPASLAGH